MADFRTDRHSNPLANKAYPTVLEQLDKLGYKRGRDYDIGESTKGIDTDATSTIKYANPTIGFKASQDLLKQGQMASWYANPKYGGSITIISTLGKLSGKKVETNNAQQVYNDLNPIKQKEVVKAIYKHEGGSGILNTFESFDQKVNASRQQNYSDTQILDNLAKLSPSLTNKITKTRALFGKDPMINNDGDILARLSQLYAGNVPTSPQGKGVVPPDQKNKAIAQKGGMDFIPGQGVVQPPKKGVIGGAVDWLGKNIVQPFKDFGTATEATANRQVEGKQTLLETAGQGAAHGLDLAFTLGFNVVKGVVGSALKADKGILEVVAPKQMAEMENKVETAKKVLSDNPAAKKGLELLTTSISKYDDWASKNPRLADDVGSAFTLGTSFIGGKEAEKPLQEGISSLKEGLGKGVNDEAKSLSKIQELISPKEDVKEARLATKEGRLIKGKKPTLFKSGTPDTVIPSSKVVKSAETISKKIPGASKMSEPELVSAIDGKVGEISEDIKPKMEKIEITEDVNNKMNSQIKDVQKEQIKNADATEELNVRKEQRKFKEFVNKKNPKNLKELWDTRIEYDNSIPDNVKKANSLSSESLQNKKARWLQNRGILNDAINDSATGLGEESSGAFSDMHDMYNAKENILSKAKIETKVQPSKIYQALSSPTAKKVEIGAGVLGLGGLGYKELFK